MNPILQVDCDEPTGIVKRSVYRMPLSPENLMKFWQQSKKYPTLFGFDVGADADKFVNLFFKQASDGTYTSDSLFYVIDDFVGMFRISDIRHPEDAQVHYTFFDGRHKGRSELVKAMIKWVFNHFDFHRLSVEIPNYARPNTRHFVVGLGFIYEGKKRDACFHNGDWYDVNLYSILQDEKGYLEKNKSPYKET